MFFLVLPMIIFFKIKKKNIYIYIYEVTSVVFEIDVIDGKKWVKFVAMQQDSATLIYDLHTMEGTMDIIIVTLKKMHSHLKQYSAQA